MKQRIQPIQHCGIQIQTGWIELKILDETAPVGINPVRLGSARFQGNLRSQEPAICGDALSGIDSVGNIVPKRIEVSGSRKNSADTDNGNPLGSVGRRHNEKNFTW